MKSAIDFLHSFFSGFFYRKNILRLLLLLVYIAGFITDVFIIKPKLIYTDWNADIRLFGLLFLWLAIGRILHFTSLITLKLTMCFLAIFSFVFIFFCDHPSVERIASWIYIYMAVGVVQQVFEGSKEARLFRKTTIR